MAINNTASSWQQGGFSPGGHPGARVMWLYPAPYTVSGMIFLSQPLAPHQLLQSLWLTTDHTVGSLYADILRYNADNLSITLKLWGKLDENVSGVNTFPSHSSISLHFTRQNIAYRVATESMLATAPMLSTHIVLSRRNGCHKRATTLILWGLCQFWGNSISAGLSSIHDVFLCQLWSVSIMCISELLNCLHLAPRTQFLLQMNTTMKMWGPVFMIICRGNFKM